jgi:hypothetical protein
VNSQLLADQTGLQVFSPEKFEAFCSSSKSDHLLLIIGAHSAITKHHHIDYWNHYFDREVWLITGYNSQLLTQRIDLF